MRVVGSDRVRGVNLMGPVEYSFGGRAMYTSCMVLLTSGVSET